MRQALLISVWQLSANLLLTSSPLKLCQVGWGQMHISMFLQKYLTGFNPRLWLGHSRTFTDLPPSHSCWFIVLLEGEPSAQSEVLNALDWVFIKAIAIFWCIELFFYSDESLRSLPLKNSPTEWGFFSELFSKCVAWHKPVSELYRQLFWPQGLFFALICIISY